MIGRWGARFLGRHMPCAVGRGGIRPAADKREGDGATPAGVWRILEVFARSDRRPLPCTAAAPPLRLVWCDDPGDPAYNLGILAPIPAGHPERMRRGDGLYDLVAVLDHNRPDPVPGQGSAVFLHCWRGPRHPTAGCVAFRPSDLAWVLARWRRGSRVVIRS